MVPFESIIYEINVLFMVRFTKDIGFKYIPEILVPVMKRKYKNLKKFIFL